MISCSKCKGTGRKRCPHCQGTGSVPTMVTVPVQKTRTVFQPPRTSFVGGRMVVTPQPPKTEWHTVYEQQRRFRPCTCDKGTVPCKH
jgi:hypothetical protein